MRKRRRGKRDLADFSGFLSPACFIGIYPDVPFAFAESHFFLVGALTLT